MNRKHFEFLELQLAVLKTDLDDNGHVQGGDKSYLYNTSLDKIGAYYIKVFKDWFDIFWEEGTEVEVKKGPDTIVDKVINNFLHTNE